MSGYDSDFDNYLLPGNFTLEMNFNSYFGVLYTGRPIPDNIGGKTPIKVDLELEEASILTQRTAVGYWSSVDVTFMGSIDDNKEEEMTVTMDFLLAFGAYNVTGIQGFMPMIYTEYEGVIKNINY